MIISRAPVRLSMGGGGTDLKSYYETHGGFLMAAAINKYIYVMVNKRFYESIRLSYSKTEIVDNVNDIQHPIFREALKHAAVQRQVEIVSVADVPSQCGLGTSSAFTVALLNGLREYKRDHLTLDGLAEAACRIEVDVLAQPMGKQDQYAAAFGGFRAYHFNKDGTVTVEPVRISEERLIRLQNNILLFHLKKERQATSILRVQDDRVKLGDPRAVERLHRIKEIGARSREIFETGNLDDLGDLLHEHWLAKKGLSDCVSDPFIDEAYDAGRKAGATGGKVVGAGGGGFLLLYCPGDKTNLISALGRMGLKPLWFAFEPEGAKIIFHS